MGHASRPRPHGVTTPEQFIERMRQVKEWAGLSYRQIQATIEMSGLSRHHDVATKLDRHGLPSAELVALFVRVCGCDEPTVAEWVTVRERLAAELSARGPAELSARGPAELSARGPAELSARGPAELSARRPAELSARRAAELSARRAAELSARRAAEPSARRAAELSACGPAEPSARRPADPPLTSSAPSPEQPSAAPSGNRRPRRGGKRWRVAAATLALAPILLATASLNQDDDPQVRPAGPPAARQYSAPEAPLPTAPPQPSPSPRRTGTEPDRTGRNPSPSPTSKAPVVDRVANRRTATSVNTSTSRRAENRPSSPPPSDPSYWYETGDNGGCTPAGGYVMTCG